MSYVILPVERPLDLIGADNGNIDPDLLVPIGPSGQLHHTAARSWRAMRAAALDAGFLLVYTFGGTYRSYQAQEVLFRSRYVVGGTEGGCKLWRAALWCKRLVNGKVPASAAVPGTSNHGFGLAVDTALDFDPTDGANPEDAESIGPALGWLQLNAPRFGWSWEDLSELWHLRYVTGDRIPQAVLDFEATIAPPPPAPAPGPTPAPMEEEQMILYRDRRFDNVFRVGDSAIQIGEAVFLHDTAITNPQRLTFIEDVHDQSLIAYMRSSKLTMAEMVPNGAASSFPPFDPPPDLVELQGEPWTTSRGPA